jgi:anti-anti-sigma regulatory factor
VQPQAPTAAEALPSLPPRAPSSGLGALVQLAKQCNEASLKFLVVGNARVVQTVKLVRLESFLHLQPDLETALASLATA